MHFVLVMLMSFNISRNVYLKKRELRNYTRTRKKAVVEELFKRCQWGKANCSYLRKSYTSTVRGNAVIVKFPLGSFFSIFNFNPKTADEKDKMIKVVINRVRNWVKKIKPGEVVKRVNLRDNWIAIYEETIRTKTGFKGDYIYIKFVLPVRLKLLTYRPKELKDIVLYVYP